MDLTVRRLGEAIGRYLEDRGPLQREWVAGRADVFPLEGLHARHPLVSSVDACQLAQDALEHARSDEERASAHALWRFVCAQLVERLGAAREEEIARLDRRGRVQLPEESIPFRDARLLAQREPNRARRGAIARGIAELLGEHSELFARRWDTFAETADRLGFASPLVLATKLSGADLDGLSSDAEVMLRETEDAYRDLLGYSLRFVDSTLRPLPGGAAHAHDLAFSASGVVAGLSLGPRELVVAVEHSFVAFGKDAKAAERVQTDFQEQSLKAPEAYFMALHVPDEISLSLRVHGGLADLRAQLDLTTAARAAATIDSRLPPEDRWLGDEVLRKSHCALFADLPTRERWSRGAFSLGQAKAREVARLAAFHRLTELRSTAARFALELSLLRHGPSDDRADEHRERARKSLYVEVERLGYLWEARPSLPTADALRAAAVACRYGSALEHRFDEDWWRNPAAARFFIERFAAGGRDHLDALTAALSLEPPSLTAAGRRLVSVLAA